MKTWPDTDGAVVARYLGQLRLRDPRNPIRYRQALHSFQDIVVQTQCPPSQVSRDALEAWLRERAVHWSGSTLLHRARIVNRFLDFLVQEGLVASNPIADLRAEYCVKSSKAILRALLTPDPDQALAALRQFPPFGSVLGDLMRDHIALMRTRGFRYERPVGSGASIAFCKPIRSLPSSRYRSCCSIGPRRVRPPIISPSAKSWLAPWPKPNIISIPASS
jgi:integrase/recombinase XerD